MIYKKPWFIPIFVLLFYATTYSQDVVNIVPFNGDPATMVNAQIVADTTATGGMLPNRVYQFQRDGVYLANAIFNVPAGSTLRLRAADGAGKKPIIYLYETGTGSTPTRPPGNFVVLNGANLEITNICIAGYYEYEPDRVDGVQGGLINTSAPGNSIILDGVIFSNINGQHVRTGHASLKVQVTNSIFANMGALETSNLGAGKGIDFRDVAIDTVIVENTTFVNFQDRALRHYNYGNPQAGTGNFGYLRVNHNTFVNGMGFHGLLSLGNLGGKAIITNNLFVDAFALGEDSSDATRAAEWANTGELYPNGNNRITWIFSAPNDTTQWTVKGNYYTISTEGQAWLDGDHFGHGPFPVGSQLSWHINSRLGSDSVNAFTKEDGLTLNNIPNLMTNMMTWYENPAGGDRTKNTPGDVFNRLTDDYDRRVIQYYRDTLNAAYSTASAAYNAGDGYPAGDLNWFPDKKAEWEAGTQPMLITVDGQKDDFYNTLTGPDDGYLQMQYYACNDNGAPVNNADLSAKVWSAWDQEWFYMYMEVMDNILAHSSANTYQNDGMELKIDPQPTDSVTNSIFAPNLTLFGGPGSDSLSTVTNTDPSAAQWARHEIPGGYALELGIKWSAITANGETITPAVDNVFGMAINVHDNDHPVGGTREHSIEWAAKMLDAVWNTPKYLGTVKFLADNKLQYIPKNNMTGLTNTVPYDGTPFYAKIDALRDPVYNALKGTNDGYVQIHSYAWSNNGRPANDADLSAKVWSMWDETWYYFYAEVRDDTLSGNAANVYEEDETELKFDAEPTDSVTNSIWDTRLTADQSTDLVAGDSLNNVADADKQWARRKITGGYALELAIKWSAIGHNNPETNESVTPAVDNVFGLGINFHDNDGQARRQASIIWAAVNLDNIWNTPKYLGTVTFKADNKLQYVARNNMTGLTNITPYDSTATSVEKITEILPTEFSLKQNYPNPFNPSTKIEFSVIETSPVSLKIYNTLGQLVATLINNEVKDIGFYTVNFNASRLSSGVYIYVLRQDKNVISKKMILMK